MVTYPNNTILETRNWRIVVLLDIIMAVVIFIFYLDTSIRL